MCLWGYASLFGPVHPRGRKVLKGLDIVLVFLLLPFLLPGPHGLLSTLLQVPCSSSAHTECLTSWQWAALLGPSLLPPLSPLALGGDSFLLVLVSSASLRIPLEAVLH